MGIVRGLLKSSKRWPWRSGRIELLFFSQEHIMDKIDCITEKADTYASIFANSVNYHSCFAFAVNSLRVSVSTWKTMATKIVTHVTHINVKENIMWATPLTACSWLQQKGFHLWLRVLLVYRISWRLSSKQWRRFSFLLVEPLHKVNADVGR